jgi:hypothetical protein
MEKGLMGLWGLLLPLAALGAEPEFTSVPAAGLDEYVVDGLIVDARRVDWGDQKYTLILSRTGNFTDRDERSARLYATLFADSSDGQEQRWLIQDRVDACPVDVTAEFTDQPARVSDADADGIPEFWVSYRTSCRGDVSPSTLKVIGYEGAQKYALRGSSRIPLGDNSEGGDYEADAAFKSAPLLQQYAHQLWMAVRDERF